MRHLILLLATTLAVGCGTRIEPGQFLCEPDEPGSCPAGWVCQCRGMACDWRCFAEGGSYCGDGVRDSGEQCDGIDFGGQSCADFGLGDGFQICLPDCTVYCTICGNGAVELTSLGTGEECDDGNSDPADGCSPSCTIERCGNRIVDPGEACDDGNNVAGDNCSADCVSNETCGNDIIDGAKGELCDDGEANDDLPNVACRTDCKPQRCGDGIVDDDAGEECDGPPTTTTCATLGFHDGGALSCSNTCRFDTTSCLRCGDGIKNGPEECDGDDLGDQTCGDLLYYYGDLSCLGNCSYNRASCWGRCGDGVKDDTLEACDGSDFGTDTCTDRGFYTGTLGCSDDCQTVLTGGCSGECGDGVKNGSEVCDGGDLGGYSCGNFGYYTGTPICLGTCDGFNIDPCDQYCGDGAINGAEQCDGQAQDGLYCTNYGGYQGGSLSCDGWCQRRFDRCYAPGWWPEKSGTSSWLYAVWATAPNNIYAVGSGRILRYDGQWASDYTTGTSLSDVWGSSATNIFAVGSGGTILRETGSGWGSMTSNAGGNWLFGVWGTAADNVFACGDGGTIVRYTGGTSWTAMTTGVTNRLQDIWGSSATNIYAVGSSGRVLHYGGSGSTWTNVTTGHSDSHYGIWGTSANNFYLVGTTGTKGVVLRYYYGGWYRTQFDDTYVLYDVWGSATNDIWVSGSAWAGDEVPILLHWDGVEWTTHYVGIDAALRGIYMLGAGEAVTVGTNGQIYHYRGMGWHDMQGSGVSAADLRGVWGLSPTSLFAAGTAPGGLGTVLRYTGSAWYTQYEDAGYYLQDIWGSSASNVFAVGSYGRILRYNGSWNPMTSNTDCLLQGVWGSSGTNVFAVGVLSGGSCTGTYSPIMRYNGTWSAMTSNTTASLNKVWGSSASNVYAVGGTAGGGGDPDTAVIQHFNGSGSSWTNVFTDSGYVLNDIWGSSATSIFAVGGTSFNVGVQGGVVLYYDGNTWTEMDLPTPYRLWAVTGSAFDNVFAFGELGIVLHFDGSVWTPMGFTAQEQSRSAWTLSDQQFVAAGADGSVRRFTGTFPAPYGGTCRESVALYCNMSTTGSSVGRSASISTYGCGGALTDIGPEVIYRLDAPVNGTATVTMTPATNNLDLVVMGADGAGRCQPETSCLDVSQTGGTTAESVTFALARGQPYYVSVDGYAGVSGSFLLTIDCTKE